MRLIDADETIDTLKSLGNRDYRREKGTITDAIKMISRNVYTPTIDAVPVVRCKDCMYHPDYEELSIDSCLPHKCPMWDNGDDGWGAHWNGHDEGFCDAGERRTE